MPKLPCGMYQESYLDLTKACSSNSLEVYAVSFKNSKVLKFTDRVSQQMTMHSTDKLFGGDMVFWMCPHVGDGAEVPFDP